MPILSVEAQGESIDNDYTTRDCELELWDGDPEEAGSAELDPVDCPGYAPAAVPASAWPVAVDGLKVSDVIQFPDATAAWEVTGTHWVLRDPLTGYGWDFGIARDEAGQPIDITEAGNGPAMRLRIFYDNNVEPEF